MIKCITAILAATAALSGTALAQRTTSDAEALQYAQEAPAPITPLMGDKPLAAPPKEAAPPNWEEVKAALAEMRKRDAVYERQMRAMELSRDVTAKERDLYRPKGIRAGSARAFPRMEESRLSRTALPVLAPMTEETAARARVFARKDAYAAVGELPGGVVWELLGTRMRVVGGDADTVKMRMAARRSVASATHAALGATYSINRHDDGVDMSFSKFNVAYLLSVSCPDPDADMRCAGDDFILSLADNLVLLNEQPGAAQ